jgi:hypothetical protein
MIQRQDHIPVGLSQ